MKATTRDLLILLAAHFDHELYDLAMDPGSWVAEQLGDDLVYRRLQTEPKAGAFLRGYLLERALGTDRLLRDRLTAVSRRTQATGLEAIADDLRNAADGFHVYDVAVLDDGGRLTIEAPVIATRDDEEARAELTIVDGPAGRYGVTMEVAGNSETHRWTIATAQDLLDLLDVHHAELVVLVEDEDRESSASRQHFIDTGRYLTHAETAEYSS